MLMMLRFLFLSFGSLDRMYGATSLINRNGAVLCTLSINSNMSSGVVCSICERVSMMSSRHPFWRQAFRGRQQEEILTRSAVKPAMLTS